jgi:hypothetical protein
MSATEAAAKLARKLQAAQKAEAAARAATKAKQAGRAALTQRPKAPADVDAAVAKKAAKKAVKGLGTDLADVEDFEPTDGLPDALPADTSRIEKENAALRDIRLATQAAINEASQPRSKLDDGLNHRSIGRKPIDVVTGEKAPPPVEPFDPKEYLRQVDQLSKPKHLDPLSRDSSGQPYVDNTRDPTGPVALGHNRAQARRPSRTDSLRRMILERKQRRASGAIGGEAGQLERDILNSLQTVVGDEFKQFNSSSGYNDGYKGTEGGHLVVDTSGIDPQQILDRLTESYRAGRRTVTMPDRGQVNALSELRRHYGMPESTGNQLMDVQELINEIAAKRQVDLRNTTVPGANPGVSGTDTVNPPNKIVVGPKGPDFEALWESLGPSERTSALAQAFDGSDVDIEALDSLSSSSWNDLDDTWKNAFAEGLPQGSRGDPTLARPPSVEDAGSGLPPPAVKPNAIPVRVARPDLPNDTRVPIRDDSTGGILNRIRARLTWPQASTPQKARTYLGLPGPNGKIIEQLDQPLVELHEVRTGSDGNRSAQVVRHFLPMKSHPSQPFDMQDGMFTEITNDGPGRTYTAKQVREMIEDEGLRVADNGDTDLSSPVLPLPAPEQHADQLARHIVEFLGSRVEGRSGNAETVANALGAISDLRGRQNPARYEAVLNRISELTGEKAQRVLEQARARVQDYDIAFGERMGDTGLTAPETQIRSDGRYLDHQDESWTYDKNGRYVRRDEPALPDRPGYETQTPAAVNADTVFDPATGRYVPTTVSRGASRPKSPMAGRLDAIKEAREKLKAYTEAQRAAAGAQDPLSQLLADAKRNLDAAAGVDNITQPSPQRPGDFNISLSPDAPAVTEFSRGVGDDLAAARGAVPGPLESPAPEALPFPDASGADPKSGAVTHTFRTARGSAYTQFENSTTIRNRSGAGHRDASTGVQGQSGKTIYVDPSAEAQLHWLQNPDIGTNLLPARDAAGNIIPGIANVELTTDYGPRKAGSVVAQIKYQKIPEVGKLPVEIFDSRSPVGSAGTGIHVGNEIVEVNSSRAVPEAAGAPTPAAPQKKILGRDVVTRILRERNRLRARFAKNASLNGAVLDPADPAFYYDPSPDAPADVVQMANRYAAAYKARKPEYDQIIEKMSSGDDSLLRQKADPTVKSDNELKFEAALAEEMERQRALRDVSPYAQAGNSEPPLSKADLTAKSLPNQPTTIGDKSIDPGMPDGVPELALDGIHTRAAVRDAARAFYGKPGEIPLGMKSGEARAARDRFGPEWAAKMQEQINPLLEERNAIIAAAPQATAGSTLSGAVSPQEHGLRARREFLSQKRQEIIDSLPDDMSPSTRTTEIAAQMEDFADDADAIEAEAIADARRGADLGERAAAGKNVGQSGATFDPETQRKIDEIDARISEIADRAAEDAGVATRPQLAAAGDYARAIMSGPSGTSRSSWQNAIEQLFGVPDRREGSRSAAQVLNQLTGGNPEEMKKLVASVLVHHSAALDETAVDLAGAAAPKSVTNPVRAAQDAAELVMDELRRTHGGSFGVTAPSSTPTKLVPGQADTNLPHPADPLHNSIPTADEIAAMTPEQRNEAFAKNRAVRDYMNSHGPTPGISQEQWSEAIERTYETEQLINSHDLSPHELNAQSDARHRAAFDARRDEAAAANRAHSTNWYEDENGNVIGYEAPGFQSIDRPAKYYVGEHEVKPLIADDGMPEGPQVSGPAVEDGLTPGAALAATRLNSPRMNPKPISERVLPEGWKGHTVSMTAEDFDRLLEAERGNLGGADLISRAGTIIPFKPPRPLDEPVGALTRSAPTPIEPTLDELQRGGDATPRKLAISYSRPYRDELGTRTAQVTLQGHLPVNGQVPFEHAAVVDINPDGTIQGVYHMPPQPVSFKPAAGGPRRRGYKGPMVSDSPTHFTVDPDGLPAQSPQVSGPAVEADARKVPSTFEGNEFDYDAAPANKLTDEELGLNPLTNDSFRQDPSNNGRMPGRSVDEMELEMRERAAAAQRAKQKPAPEVVAPAVKKPLVTTRRVVGGAAGATLLYAGGGLDQVANMFKPGESPAIAITSGIRNPVQTPEEADSQAAADTIEGQDDMLPGVGSRLARVRAARNRGLSYMTTGNPLPY